MPLFPCIIYNAVESYVDTLVGLRPYSSEVPQINEAHVLSVSAPS